MNCQKYYAGSYKRISKEDKLVAGSKKNESNSISNQRELIHNFVQSHPEIEIVEEYADDGFSGVNFERPDFLRMLKDIKTGVINCVIVKDLSRFGRNYIEVGKYLEQIFPALGVRFISISENYDSIYNNHGSEQLIVPFMNLINDIYCRDISVKIRTSIEMKQRKGDYVGSFAPYGYQKDPENLHHFIIDIEAANIVNRIYQLTIIGMSNRNIAILLNKEKVPSPAYYKQLKGENYTTGFQKSSEAKWSALAVRRILTNKVYLGILEQGKTYSINYKLKERKKRDCRQWYRAENTHEPIIDKKSFYLVQKLLSFDFRTSPQKEIVYLFSGLLICRKCSELLTRRKKTVKGKEYIYYGCYNKNKRLKCSNICIREDKLQKTILIIIRNYIYIIVKLLKERFLLENTEVCKQAERFNEYANIKNLNRIFLLTFIEKIVVFSANRIEIYFDYKDKFKNFQNTENI